MIVVLQAFSVVVLALLVSGVIAAGVGTWLAERSRGYRLPYEQPSHVRLLREDEP